MTMTPTRTWARLDLTLTLIFVVLIALSSGLWVMWRYQAPVEVNLASTIVDLPFEVEVFPAVITARPGEVVSVTYRIYNSSSTPLEAVGTIKVEPGTAVDQIEVFISQCSGMNTFQSNFPEEYVVMFRVDPAGLQGHSQLTLRHVFEPVNSRGGEIK